jgi:coenzyme F420-0:L-glutamate ligase/coenzyme F420-1:gamma-L-glutamate ligase
MKQHEVTGLTVLPVPGLPLFVAGDSICEAITTALIEAEITLQDRDVIVIAQKIISKAEGRTRNLSGVEPSPHAMEAAAKSHKNPAVVELIASESQELMRVVPGVVIARNNKGHVLANAGIDASNIAPGQHDSVLLWPENPDASARTLRDGLEARFDVRLAVIISDSLGRAWRMGTMGTAIGVSGMKPVRDRRGEKDLFGRTLESTVIGVADEIAAAASLVIGEGAEGTPAVIVRGAHYDADDEAAIDALIRPLEQDLFR